jgi:hypothetical protein
MAARVNQTRHHSPGGFDPSFGKSRTEIIVELGRGAGDGAADLAADAAKIDLLHVPRGVARLAQSAWESEWGLTGLATVVLAPVRQQIEAAADAAATGDFRGAAAAGVKAVTVAVSTGITIGELGAAAVDAVQSAGAVGSRRPSVAQRERLFEKSKDAGGTPRCVYCNKEITPSPGRPDSYEADHKQPFSRGGPTTDDNLAPACRTCNRSKGAKTPEEFKGP